jgi:hypothetical protein
MTNPIMDMWHNRSFFISSSSKSTAREVPLRFNHRRGPQTQERRAWGGSRPHPRRRTALLVGFRTPRPHRQWLPAEWYRPGPPSALRP